jgi:hypothetical protein
MLDLNDLAMFVQVVRAGSAAPEGVKDHLPSTCAASL